MDIRYAANPEDFKGYTTERLRRDFLIQNLFEPGRINMVYSHVDRIIAGAAYPASAPLPIEASKELGVDFFLQRRELGIINIGAAGMVIIDGIEYPMQHKDGLYVGMGAREVLFKSDDVKNPAKFYFNSAPAHTSYPVVKIDISKANPLKLGSAEESNSRTIYQYIHPNVCQSCQLLMGLTMLEPNNVWNTMPCHTHDRRMEVYLYFDIPDGAAVFHLMGEPSETRHLVVRNEEAVISPSWSIHAGVGTKNYTFIWGMVGENQTFTDMDTVPMNALL